MLNRSLPQSGEHDNPISLSLRPAKAEEQKSFDDGNLPQPDRRIALEGHREGDAPPDTGIYSAYPTNPRPPASAILSSGTVESIDLHANTPTRERESLEDDDDPDQNERFTLEGYQYTSWLPNIGIRSRYPHTMPTASAIILWVCCLISQRVFHT